MAAPSLCCFRRMPVQWLLFWETFRKIPLRGFALGRPAFDSQFRSAYSLDQLYQPQEREADTAKDLASQTIPEIPVGRLSVSYSRSSGPGGQNVNKVNSKAEVRFHLASADWISEEVRQKMAVLQKHRINKLGELIITSEVSRYQLRNMADCLQKIRNMIAESTMSPHVISEETAEMIRKRVEKMNRERLRQKKARSSLKQSRQVDYD
ncbi:large ribosomal subunit protein mL62 [Ahaetulla prasina]|uniref:large ribosomal subunit protein mL62 n=1 Tax=Ahaetulla prasina TaxID=499056 RepID=UPI00264877EA|nr:large ribosomal subunit protein mL62 [Ahaetulla prasina]